MLLFQVQVNSAIDNNNGSNISHISTLPRKSVQKGNNKDLRKFSQSNSGAKVSVSALKYSTLNTSNRSSTSHQQKSLNASPQRPGKNGLTAAGTYQSKFSSLTLERDQVKPTT